MKYRSAVSTGLVGAVSLVAAGAMALALSVGSSGLSASSSARAGLFARSTGVGSQGGNPGTGTSGGSRKGGATQTAGDVSADVALTVKVDGNLRLASLEQFVGALLGVTPSGSTGGSTGGSTASPQDNGAGIPVNGTFTATGGVDLTSGVGELSGTLPPTLPAVGGAPVALRVIGNQLYVQLPLVSSIDGGANWVNATLPSGVTSALQVLLSAVMTGSPSIVTALQHVAKVENLGAQTVGGVATTEYAAQVNLGRVLEVIRGDRGGSKDHLQAPPSPSDNGGPPPASAVLRDFLDNLTVPVAVWLDSSGRLVQGEARAHLFGLNVDLQLALSNFGSGGVEVSAPPASDTASLSTVLAALKTLLQGVLPGPTQCTTNSGDAHAGLSPADSNGPSQCCPPPNGGPTGSGSSANDQTCGPPPPPPPPDSGANGIPKLIRLGAGVFLV
ncbi:MAG: hypothetical protein M0020_08220 [Actinomycetota bacterium]|nr:hypothetical protein [Actinomycetota bacterium]